MIKIILIFIACWSPLALSAVDMFIKIDGIEGEATDHEHQDWIPVLATQYQQVTPINNVGKALKKANCPKVSSITFTKKTDSSSTDLFRYNSTGVRVDKATIHWIQTEDRQPFLMYELKNVMITSISMSGTVESDVPTEQITLTYSEVTWQYIDFESQKVATGGWNIHSKCKA